MKPVVFSSLAVSLVVLGACSRSSSDDNRPETIAEHVRRNPNEQDRSGAATLTGASWIASESALDRIVASRCAREVSCSNVGPGRHFTSGEVCVREVRDRVRESLKKSACPSGIDGKELDECLDAIRSESCSSPLDAVNRLAACRTSELCLKTEAPHR
jgi:Family of unknown function (DUF6184)